MTLPDLLLDLSQIDTLPRAVVFALYKDAAMLEAALRARLLGADCVAMGADHQDDRHETPAKDQEPRLTPEDAAARLGVEKAWIYDHWRKIPGARKLSRKKLRFTEAGLVKFARQNR